MDANNACNINDSNSVNMALLYQRMRQDQVMQEDKLTFLFNIYSRLTIHLGNEMYQLIRGVPQGEINSSPLFGFAMYNLLTDTAARINSAIQTLEGPPPPRGNKSACTSTSPKVPSWKCSLSEEATNFHPIQEPLHLERKEEY